ncbi:MAG: electron transport complex subunit RsxC [Bacillota bacterium]|nr:electron transport complex subunit RsxC [Bacillota bacterium]
MSSKGLTFRGGIHPPHFKKQTEDSPIEEAFLPKEVVIPLHQHIGAPCESIVKVGDNVKVGQKIGDTKAFVSAPVHSSVSGIVTKIAKRNTPTGSKVTSIVIQVDGKQEISEEVQPKGDLGNLKKDDILKIVKEAGLTGMGGAGFPTHVKLSPPEDKKIDILIINGAECEPYLTSDHRMMLEYPERVVLGTKAIMKALEVTNGVIGIEKNKPDAIKTMKEAVKNEESIKVAELQTKYPQGGEKSLIYAVTKREVPSGGLPMDVGAVVQNIGTVAALAEAITTGMPVVHRVVTITGSAVKEPKNLLVKIGTKFKDVVEQCGGYTDDLGKVINGGPMMGIAQYTDDVPVIKGTSGILILNERDSQKPEPSNCIRCGKCVDICPSGLLPLMISKNSLLRKFDEAESYNAMDCIECGSCSFICPSKRPLVDAIRVAKQEIIAKRKKN